jgi:hypothetical protein
MANKEAQPQQPTADQNQAPGLALQDLLIVVQIIQLCSQRGTFRADELEQVGALYNKLIAFLQSVGALQPAQSEETKND